MPNPYFQFKQFTIHHDRCSMKVSTDSCLFGAWVAHSIRNVDGLKNVLDIGSGSGLLGLMTAQLTSAFIEGIELQESDYLQSIQNVHNSRFSGSIHIHQADALQFPYNKQYDGIISNPPFYENELKGAVSGKNIAHHDEGLKLSELLNLIARQLAGHGRFYLLLPGKRWPDLQQLIVKTSLFINEIVWVHQTEKHAAFRIMLQGSFTKRAPGVQKILIKEDGAYSNAFISLLKDYYLYL